MDMSELFICTLTLVSMFLKLGLIQARKPQITTMKPGLLYRQMEPLLLATVNAMLGK